MKTLQRIATLGTVVALSLLCSCGQKPASESQPTAEGVENGKKDSYAEAYCEVLRYLLDQHGYVHSFSISSEPWQPQAYEGLEYAALADLERDGVPELICGYRSYIPSEQRDWYDEDRRVSVFRYDDGVVRELLNVPYSGRLEFWGDWGSEYLYLKTDGEQPFLMVTDCNGGYIERASVFTLENGVLQCHTGIGRAASQDGEYVGDFCYIYTACQIDGKPVPVDEYVRFIDSHAQEAKALWAYYGDGGWLAEAETNQAALQTFLDELTAQAGAEKIDLADYAEAKKQRKAAPYEGEPYVLGNVREEAEKLTPPTPTEDVWKDYQTAKLELFSTLLTQYQHGGVEIVDRDVGNISHIGYDEIDFENDGLPEIIVYYIFEDGEDQNDTIYTVIYDVFCYSDESFHKLLRIEKTTDDLSNGKWFLTIGTWNHQYFTMIDSLYYTIQNGALIRTDFTCDSDGNGNKIYTINGEAVSPEAFEAAMQAYDYGPWFYGNGMPLKDELRSLAADLGMSTEEINQLLGASQAKIPLESMVQDRYHVEYEKPEVCRLDITIPMFREDLPGAEALNRQIEKDWSSYLNIKPEDFSPQDWGFSDPAIQVHYEVYFFGSVVELVVRRQAYSLDGSGPSASNCVYCYDVEAGEAVSLDGLMGRLGMTREDAVRAYAEACGEPDMGQQWVYEWDNTDLLHFFYIDGDGTIQIEVNQ